MGLKPTVLLNSGLWYYCRHPNYFGENLWWAALSWGYGLVIYHWPLNRQYYDVAIVGTPAYIILGWFINFLVMWVSINMIETHMTTPPKDASHSHSHAIPKHIAYRYYQEYTSCFLPWYSSQCSYLHNIQENYTKLKKF